MAGGGKPPAGAPIQLGPRHTDLRPGVPLYPSGIYPWTMEDQAKLVAKALSETPFLQEETANAALPREASAV